MPPNSRRNGFLSRQNRHPEDAKTAENVPLPASFPRSATWPSDRRAATMVGPHGQGPFMPAPAPMSSLDSQSVYHGQSTLPIRPATPGPHRAGGRAGPADVAQVPSRSESLPGYRYGPYQVGERLGRGGNGVVFAARHVNTGVGWAIKKDIAADTRDMLLDKEAMILLTLQAQYPMENDAIMCNGLWNARTSPNATFQKVMVLEQGSCSLESVIEDREYMLDPLVLLKTLLRVLLNCRQLGIHHRDIKPSNILLVGLPAHPAVKLIDFGNSTAHDSDQLPVGDPFGHSYHLAPELIRDVQDGAPELWQNDTTYDAHKADVWALGVVFHQFVTRGGFPFRTHRKICARRDWCQQTRGTTVWVSEPARKRYAPRRWERTPTPALDDRYKRIIDAMLDRDAMTRFGGVQLWYLIDGLATGIVPLTPPPSENMSLDMSNLCDVSTLSDRERRFLKNAIAPLFIYHHPDAIAEALQFPRETGKLGLLVLHHATIICNKVMHDQWEKHRQEDEFYRSEQSGFQELWSRIL